MQIATILVLVEKLNTVTPRGFTPKYSRILVIPAIVPITAENARNKDQKLKLICPMTSSYER
jgi:hypothetical protein